MAVATTITPTLSSGGVTASSQWIFMCQVGRNHVVCVFTALSLQIFCNCSSRNNKTYVIFLNAPIKALLPMQGYALFMTIQCVASLCLYKCTLCVCLCIYIYIYILYAYVCCVFLHTYYMHVCFGVCMHV